LGLIASPAFALILLGRGQLGPNTRRAALRGPFDGERAFADLEKLVSFGPRPSGSQALERARTFIIAELNANGVTVGLDKFVAMTPLGAIPITNVVAKIPGASPLTIIIGGHYDTKHMTTRFVGANDGGSSAAFLLELARVLARKRNGLTYWLVFFDGEEALQRWSATDGLYGSRHFAQELAFQHLKGRVKAVIVVDMIADRHLDIQREARSTPWLAELVVRQAQRFGYGHQFVDSSKAVDDDHLPFLGLGIPAIDIIDLDYGPLNAYWHTRFDTVDKCSTGSLAIVGNTVLSALDAFESGLKAPDSLMSKNPRTKSHNSAVKPKSELISSSTE